MADKKMWTIEYSDADNPKAVIKRVEIEAEKLMFDPGNNYSESGSVDNAVQQIWTYDPDFFWRDLEVDDLEDGYDDIDEFEADCLVFTDTDSWKDVLNGEPVQVGRDWDRYMEDDDEQEDDIESVVQSFSVNVALYDGDRKLTREDLFVKEKDEGKGGK